MSGNLILILGDQLNRSSAAFDGFDPSRDRVWMAEVVEESTHVWSHKARIVLFLSAMRHFRDQLRAEGMRVVYRSLAAEPLADEPTSLAASLLSDLALARRGSVPAPQAQASGPDACPFTMLYWDFLARHERLLRANPRMGMQLKNLERKPAADLRTIRRQADTFRDSLE